MYSRCLDLFFSCYKSKKPELSRKSLFTQQIYEAQSECELEQLISKEIASDMQTYWAQARTTGAESLESGIPKKKTLPQLAAEMRVKYKLYEQKRAELSRFPQENPEYPKMEAAVKQAQTVCFEAEKKLLEGMYNHKAYLSSFEEGDTLQAAPPQMKF